LITFATVKIETIQPYLIKPPFMTKMIFNTLKTFLWLSEKLKLSIHRIIIIILKNVLIHRTSRNNHELITKFTIDEKTILDKLYYIHTESMSRIGMQEVEI